MGLNLVRDPSTGEMYTMPYMSIQTFWVYNKDIFEEAGITDVPAQPLGISWWNTVRKSRLQAISLSP